MKKLVSSALALSVLFSGAAGIVNHNEANAATNSKAIVKKDIGYSPIIHFNILKSKSVAISLKEGTFNLHGIKLGTNLYNATHSNIDKPSNSFIMSDRGHGTIYSANYELNDYTDFASFTSLSKNDDIDHKTMKIQSMQFMSSIRDKNSKDLTKFRDVSAALGKPKHVTQLSNNAKEIVYSNYLTIGIAKKYKTWYVESINYHTPGFEKMQSEMYED